MLIDCYSGRALQDDPRVQWDPVIISDILKEYVTKNGIDTVSMIGLVLSLVILSSLL